MYVYMLWREYMPRQFPAFSWVLEEWLAVQVREGRSAAGAEELCYTCCK